LTLHDVSCTTDHAKTVTPTLWLLHLAQVILAANTHYGQDLQATFAYRAHGVN